MVSAISTASAGVQAASMRFDKAARQTANVGAGGGADVLSAVTDAVEAKSSFDVNIAMLRAASDMQKRVLDIIV